MRNDGLIIPDNERVQLQPFIVVGLTDNWQVGVYWPNEQMRHAMINRMTASELQRIKDALITAFNNSVNKRLPTVINNG